MTAGERVRAGIIVIGVIEMAALGTSKTTFCLPPESGEVVSCPPEPPESGEVTDDDNILFTA